MAIVATAACPPSLKGPLTAGPADTRPPRLQRALAAASGGVSGYGGGDVPDLPPWPGLGGVAGDTGRPGAAVDGPVAGDGVPKRWFVD